MTPPAPFTGMSNSRQEATMKPETSHRIVEDALGTFGLFLMLVVGKAAGPALGPGRTIPQRVRRSLARGTLAAVGLIGSTVDWVLPVAPRADVAVLFQ
jgi:hypothetical protein